MTASNSIVGRGRVLVLSNPSPRHLTLRVSLENPTFGSNGVFAVAIGPGELFELGWREGWRLASVDDIRIEHAEHTPLRLTVP